MDRGQRRTRDRLEAVSAAYDSRGSRVLHTANCGAVQVSIADGQVSVDSWRTDVE